MTTPRKTTTEKLRKRAPRKAKKKPTWTRHATINAFGFRIDLNNGYKQGRWRQSMQPTKRDRRAKYNPRNRMRLQAGTRLVPDPYSDERPRPLLSLPVSRNPTQRIPSTVRAENRKRNRQARKSRRLNR